MSVTRKGINKCLSKTYCVATIFIRLSILECICKPYATIFSSTLVWHLKIAIWKEQHQQQQNKKYETLRQVAEAAQSAQVLETVARQQ